MFDPATGVEVVITATPLVVMVPLLLRVESINFAVEVGAIVEEPLTGQ